MSDQPSLNKYLLNSVVSGIVLGTENHMVKQKLFPQSVNSDRKRQAINKQISEHKLYQIGTNADKNLNCDMIEYN